VITLSFLQGVTVREGFPTPAPALNLEEGSPEYLAEENRLLKALVNEMRDREPDPVADKVLSLNWFKAKDKKKKHRRITSVHGSMKAIDMLSRLSAAAMADKVVQDKKDESEAEMRKAYDKCKDGCTCGGPCVAGGFFLCTTCTPQAVKRSMCQKKACKDARSNGQVLGYRAPLPKGAAPRKGTKRPRVRAIDCDAEAASSDSEGHHAIIIAIYLELSYVMTHPAMQGGEVGYESDGDDGGESGSDDGAGAGGGFAVGDAVRVYWHTGVGHDKNEFIVGQVTENGPEDNKRHVTVYYPLDDAVFTHNPDHWDVILVAAIGEAGFDANALSDDDDMPLPKSKKNVL
jgi:hypothetical protein